MITFLWKLKGEALAALGRTEKASSLLRAGIEIARATEERFMIWRIHVCLGRMYHARKHQTINRKEFLMARELFHELAATVPDEALKDNFLHVPPVC